MPDQSAESRAAWRAHDGAQTLWVDQPAVPGLRLFLRRRAGPGEPVLFVHGATLGSRLFDIPHPGASWMQALAACGFDAYGVDVRGYGRSRPADGFPTDRPYARAGDAVEDIACALAAIRERRDGARVHLIGGSWGSITTALYASDPARASALASLTLYAPIFAERNQPWIDLIADPEAPDRPNPALGAARAVTEADMRARWDSEIPHPDPTVWRDEAVFRALIDASLADDPGAATRDPPAFLAPNGTLLDLWETFHGRPLYDPTRIRTPSLLLRGGADPTSTRTDALALFDRLGAADKRYQEIAGGAHFISAERRARQVFAASAGFLESIEREA
ncbi:MAG: alpha/beta fold hydrolase [Marivibrio sp.]|uniref:alpha/beta hydrolase n=1 Tax=Marivibrio sp. TaxID=2039719 RepID=UPI0032EEF3FC